MNREGEDVCLERWLCNYRTVRFESLWTFFIFFITSKGSGENFFLETYTCREIINRLSRFRTHVLIIFIGSRVSATTLDEPPPRFRPQCRMRREAISPPRSVVPIGPTTRRWTAGPTSAWIRNRPRSSCRTSATRTRPCTSAGSISKSRRPAITKSTWPSSVSIDQNDPHTRDNYKV